ncbi:MAG: UDP-2,3-diacylglucosamine diphosphatase [Bacteroidales bacterium]
MSDRKKIYFATDAHFGLSGPEKSLPRERLFVKWLDFIRKDAREIWLLGDIFDFWFEYRRVVPRGYTRILGKIAEITDSGIPVHFFTGNHDIWVFDYLPKETGMIIHKEPVTVTFSGKKFFLAHGDGLDGKDHGFKILKWAFTNPAFQWMFARLHPNFAMWFGHRWSHNSRYSKELITPYRGPEGEEHMIFANKMLEKEHFDYFVFGHRHLPFNMPLNNGTSRCINLGDWLWHFSYGVFDGQTMEVRNFPAEEIQS